MKEIIKKFLKNRTNIILAIFVVYLIDTNLENTAFGYTSNIFSNVSKLIRYMCYLIFTINIFCDWKSGEKITWTMLIAGITSIVVYIISKNTYLMLLFIVMLGVRNIEIKQIVKLAYYTNLITFIVVILLAVTGIIPNWIYYRENMELRYSLGYHYPTIVSTYFLFIVLMKFYLEKEKINIFKLIVEAIIACILYYFSDSRTGFILTIIIILTTLVIKIIKKYNININITNKKNYKIINKIICSIPIILLIFVVIISVYSENPLSQKIDKLISGRIYYTNQALNNYGITLFGKEITWYGWGGYGYIEQENFNYNFVDIAYMQILFDCGIITLILFMISYIIILKKNLEKKDYYTTYILMLVFVWGMIEPNILSISINIFILMLIPIFNYGVINKLDYNNLLKFIKREEKVIK